MTTNAEFDEQVLALDRLYFTLNSGRSTPVSSIEAIKQAVRDRGVSALDEPATVARMRECDAAARAEIRKWLANRKAQ